jgi:hypothetical protein
LSEQALKSQQPQGTSKLLLRSRSNTRSHSPGRWTGPAGYPFPHLRACACCGGSGRERRRVRAVGRSRVTGAGGARRGQNSSRFGLDIWPNFPMLTWRVRHLSMILSY